MTSESAVAAAFGMLPMLGEDLKLRNLNSQLLCQNRSNMQEITTTWEC